MSAAAPFLGEIYMFAGNFAPRGWALCNGQLLSISQNDALFALLGTTYGGDGITTFQLPNLQGRLPLHQGNEHVQGQVEGSETVTLVSTQIPAHTHGLRVSSAISSQDGPSGNTAADTTLAGVRVYTAPLAPAAMNPSAVGLAGGGQPHENRMPYVAINFIIALEGIFPSQN